MRTCAFSLLLLVAVTASAQVHFNTVSREVLEQRLKNSSRNDSERAAILKQDFADAGCGDLTEQPVKHVKQPNVVCVIRGESDATILIGAHLDHVDAGAGVVDDWTGAAMLPSLVQGMVGSHPKHTYVFVGFSGEEGGLLGSEFYVKQVGKEQLKQIAAMVNLECLGLAPTEVWQTHSDKNLVGLLAGTASALHLPISAVNVDRVGNDDSDSFKRRKVPNVTLHSISQQTWPILHSSKDTLAAINLDDYYQSYRLVAAYLAVLDDSLALPATGSTPSQK